jgi:diaminopropionate ammonia-lyase
MSQYSINPNARAERNYRGLFEAEEYRLVNDFFCSRPEFEPTPLMHLRALASELGVGDILLKNESARLGLNSFKILGASYAVRRLLGEGRLADDSVVVCASEGNHGRAVARVAAENKLGAKIYVASATSSMRIEVIEKEGAEVIVVDGNYDDAVKQAACEARRHDWQVISDTSWSEYEEIPRWIMLGYTKLMTEAEMQWSPDPPPDVVFVQAGVGGLACAVVSWLCLRYGTKRPFVIVCEPASAACLLESSRAGKPITLNGPFNTIMAGLRCGEVSAIAWPTLATAVDAFVSIDDEQCTSAMRTLAHPSNGDPVVVAGASGACGLAALVAILQDERLRPVREMSGVSVWSRILVINTEGATDPELYVQVTGRDASTLSTTHD